jgi:hypothetical protein
VSDSTTPTDGPALIRALHLHSQRQLRELSESQFRVRLVTAAGIDPDKLSPQAQRTLDWLTGWDSPTIDGLVEILTATRTAAQIAIHGEQIARKVQALRDTEAATEAALALFDEQEAERLGRG